MTDEEIEQKFKETYPDYMYGDTPLSPYYDIFCYGIELMEQEIETLKHNKKTVAHLSSCISDIQKKKIADLEKKVKEYEYLGIKELQADAERLAKGNNYLTEQLEQAKIMLKDVISSYNHDERFTFEKVLKRAEQFIKENE